MTLTLAMIAAAIGGVATLVLGIAFFIDPDAGFRVSQHRRSLLPKAMAGRYFAFTLLALAAALYGDALVILVLFAVFAIVSFFDAFTYASEGEPWWIHAAAGALCFVVIALAGIAYVAGH